MPNYRGFPRYGQHEGCEARNAHSEFRFFRDLEDGNCLQTRIAEQILPPFGEFPNPASIFFFRGLSKRLHLQTEHSSQKSCSKAQFKFCLHAAPSAHSGAPKNFAGPIAEPLAESSICSFPSFVNPKSSSTLTGKIFGRQRWFYIALEKRDGAPIKPESSRAGQRTS